MTADNSSQARAVLGPHGVFAREYPGFTARDAQAAMAHIVESLLSQESERCAIEMPSGGGKTLAYLVPVLLADKRVVVATATVQLQHQLFRHDIPAAIKVLGQDKTVAMLKGRRHYLCPYYLEKALTTNALKLHQQQLLRQAQQRYEILIRSQSGDLSQSIDKQITMVATSSADDCLGQQCPKILRCPYFLARRRAQEATLVITNQSLLVTELQYEEPDANALWKDRDAIIVDEAHRLSEAVIAQGQVISSRQLQQFCRDARSAVALHAADDRQVDRELEKLQGAIDRVTLILADEEKLSAPTSVIAQFHASIFRLSQWLEKISERGQYLVEAAVRASKLSAHLQRFLNPLGDNEIRAIPRGFLMRWMPAYQQNQLAQDIAKTRCSWLFTSATLATSGSVVRFFHAAGITPSNTVTLPSEFDWSKSAALLTPQMNSMPDSAGFYSEYSDHVEALLSGLSGRVLMLFSSYHALHVVAAQLQTRLRRPCLIQDEEKDANLLRRCKMQKDSVIFATGSFWEGVDLSGVPLRAVLIDKLPFANPVDETIQRRAAYLSRYGIDHFQEELLPDAISRLRQGVGRLLRRRGDRGVILLADPRVDTHSYGRQFLASLPPMQRYKSLAEMAGFLASLSDDQQPEPD